MEIITNPVLLFSIAVAGLVVGLIPFLLGLKKKRFAFCSNSFELVKNWDSTVNGLTVKYDDKEIRQLAVSRIAIWYNGRGCVSSSSLAKLKPLSIRANNGADILDAHIVSMSDEDSMVSISEKNANGIKFNFDYFDCREGFVIEVVHTGGINDLNLIGKIQGGVAPKRVGRVKKTTRKIAKYLRKASAVAMVAPAVLVSLLTIIIGVLLSAGQTWILVPPGQEHLITPLMSICIAECILINLSAYYTVSREYRLDVPAYFRRYLDLE